MDRRTWDALDEQEQETELHEAHRIAAACAHGDVFGGYERHELTRALAVLACEFERVVELEGGISEPRRRDM